MEKRIKWIIFGVILILVINSIFLFKITGNPTKDLSKLSESEDSASNDLISSNPEDDSEALQIPEQEGNSNSIDEPDKIENVCYDSDKDKDYYTKGYISHSDGAKEYDKCDTENVGYEDFVIEFYCISDGNGQINYKCPYGCSNGACNPKPNTTEIIVSSVIDGDTIKLSTGESVRLIGINAPETGEFCSLEATNKLKELILGKKIISEKDVEDKDQYGRLLRYVFINGINVNIEIVRLGLAHAYEYGSNTKYLAQIKQAEDEAKQNEGCLWKSSEKDYIQDKCISLTNFHYDASGNDNYNLNDEYVTFKNKCSYLIDLSSWTIKDNTASHIFTIPQFILRAGATFSLYTGIGINSDSVLYWGRSSGNYAAIWNNDHDTLYLRDNEGSLVLDYNY